MSLLWSGGKKKPGTKKPPLAPPDPEFDGGIFLLIACYLIMVACLLGLVYAL